jgi:hypothetical protein
MEGKAHAFGPPAVPPGRADLASLQPLPQSAAAAVSRRWSELRAASYTVFGQKLNNFNIVK